MTVTRSDIDVGKCFKTDANQHRRILAINGSNTHLIYESWGGNVNNPTPPLSQNEVKIDNFINAVESVIPCNPDLTPLQDVSIKPFKN